VKDRTADFRALASAARIDDVNSPEAVVFALYDAISGPAGEERDWDRIRSLFDPAARLLIGRWLSASDTRRSVVYEWDVDAFIQEGREYWLPDGFWERQLAARTEVFGKIAHVFSAYESRMGSEASPPIGRGVNSVQLLQHAERWWIVSLVWDVETPGHTVPTDLRFED
jgi:hypothetical protein